MKKIITVQRPQPLIEVEMIGGFPPHIYENTPPHFNTEKDLALFLETIALDIASIESNMKSLRTMHDLQGCCEKDLIAAAKALRWKETQRNLVIISYRRWLIRNGRRSPIEVAEKPRLEAV